MSCASAQVPVFTVRDVIWAGGAAPGKEARFSVRIRHSHTAAPAKVSLLPDAAARVVFETPQFGVAPGQSAVFYSDDIVEGGGIIDVVEDAL